jgi:predicted transglutaminase-like cysteine proteinase
MARLGQLFVFLVLIPTTVPARDLPRYTTVVEPAGPPSGWDDFCERHRKDCEVPADKTNMVDLTPEIWTVMERVNSSVNRRLKERPDLKLYGKAEYWTYPANGYGDCEDYVLEKRKELIRAGLPARALLIAIVWTRQNNGHAVLLVRTDQGSYVLDNLRPSIALWSLTPYDFVKRQSETDPTQWVYTDGPKAEPRTVDSQQQRGI